MKKLLLLFVIALSLTTVSAQEDESKFPYGKMLKMTHDELIDANFKFNSKKNQYVLTKQDGLNATASILGALSGRPTNYVPHVNDYMVLIQNGENQVSTISVTFYDSELYHQILTFAVDNGENLLETNSIKTNQTQFNFAGYSFTLGLETVGQATSVAARGVAVNKDQSYSIYTFTIFTGVAPYSDWHTKQAAKQQKRDEQGKKKRSAADLM